MPSTTLTTLTTLTLLLLTTPIHSFSPWQDNHNHSDVCLSQLPVCTVPHEKLYRVSLFYNKRPDISDEEFNRHWAYTHPELAGDMHTRNGIVKYSQYHSTKEFRDLIPASFPIPTLAFDGVAEFWTASMQNMLDMQNDPVYLAKVLPDEANFIDASSMRIMVGGDFLVVENGVCVGEEGHGREF